MSEAVAAALNSVEIQRGERSEFWRYLGNVNDTLYFEVTAWDYERYVIELQCDQFGAEAIRGRFVDPETHKCTSDAWPKGDETFQGWFKWKPEHFFICWPGDRGGIAHHPEWQARAYWKTTSNQLYQYLDFIRLCLNLRARGYQPRQKHSHAA